MPYTVPANVSVTQTVIVGPRKELLKEGVIVANGDEQVVVETYGIAVLEGYIDLSAMEDGDTVIVRRYVKIQEGGDYILYAKETYTGVQEQPLVRFPPMTSCKGMMITLQQTVGVFKSFPYQFIIER